MNPATEKPGAIDDVPMTPVGESWKKCTGKGVSIAVIDSGIETGHEAFSGRIGACYEAVRDGNRISFVETDTGDSAGHGTACAGIILAIAPDAELCSVKVLGAAGVGDGHVFLSGLEFAIEQGFDIINLSLGTTRPQLAAPLHDLLDRAYRAGSVIVSAANNLPQPSLPSIFSSSLVSVSKSDETDPLSFKFLVGDQIELKAPGINIRTAWLKNGYKSLTGNSFACPHISGVLALLMERYPGMTPFQAKTALYAIANSGRGGAEFWAEKRPSA